MAKIGIGSLYKNQTERVAVIICQEYSIILLHNLKAEELNSNIVGTSANRSMSVNVATNILILLATFQAIYSHPYKSNENFQSGNLFVHVCTIIMVM